MITSDTAAKYDIVIDQGSTFVRTFTFTAGITDLTGYVARMQIRERVSSSDTILSLTVGSGLTMTTTTISVAISATATAALDFNSGVYDLEIESAGGVVTRILYGTVKLSREVTR